MFFSIFLYSFEICIKIEHFEKKDDPHWFFIIEITDYEKVVSGMSKKSSFRGPLEEEHGNRFQTRLKFASQQR